MAGQQPTGVGGWLVLVAIGLVLAPFRILFQLAQDILPVFTNGAWEILTDPASASFHPLWAPLIVFELVGSVVFVAASIAALVLFARRSPLFPRAMVWYYLSNLGFIAADFFALDLIPAVAGTQDSVASQDLLRSMLATAIWVPYMYRSRRVKNTFGWQ